MFSVLSLHVVSSLPFLLSGLRPLIRARISAGLFIFRALAPSCLSQASICRADVSQVGASPLGLRPLQQIFLYLLEGFPVILEP